jgi:DNA-binding response OmpR family regulator
MTLRGKIMVVDDDALVLRMLQMRLEKAGFAVVTRDRAIGTMQAINTERPDVVILDIQMPALTGPTLAELIGRTMNVAVPVIFHSSQSLSALQAAAQQSGALGAISKTADDTLFMAQFERLYDRIKRKVQKTS